LRAGEIGDLTRGNFRLDDKQPVVVLTNGEAKNGKDVAQPLRADTAALLRDHLADKLPLAKAFNIPESDDTAEMLYADLEAADIPKKLGSQVVDFHGLRHTFITNLANSGVHPKVAMDLARHSDINLTMKRYSHTVLEQRAEAVNRLPELRIGRAVAVATGTAGPESAVDSAWRPACCSGTESSESRRTMENGLSYAGGGSRTLMPGQPVYSSYAGRRVP